MYVTSSQFESLLQLGLTSNALTLLVGQTAARFSIRINRLEYVDNWIHSPTGMSDLPLWTMLQRSAAFFAHPLPHACGTPAYSRGEAVRARQLDEF
jgi:hypothetical protein